MEIKLKIKDGKLFPGTVLSANSGNMNVNVCKFEITKDYGLTWFCVFKREEAIYQQLIENGSCVIPSEILETPGMAQLGCYATGEGKRISTNWLEFLVEEGAYCQATAPSEPTPDVWETLMLNTVPCIGANGNWYIYDKEQAEYKDSGVSSLGQKGDKGNTGEKGADGHTPVLGVDYWTDKDKNEIVESVEKELNFEERLAKVVGNAGNSLKNTVSGSVVLMNDVSPMEHFLNVSVKSDEVADLTAVRLKKYGKNLLNYPQLSKGEFEKDGTISIVNGTETALYVSTPFMILPKGVYTFSVETREISGQYGIFVQLGSATDWSRVVPNINTAGKKALTFTLDKATTVRILNEVKPASSLKFRVQINEGSQAQVFETYKNPVEYIPLYDGSVSGVLADYPAVTLLSEQDGITVECEYSRDIGKAVEELKNAIISLGGNV